MNDTLNDTLDLITPATCYDSDTGDFLGVLTERQTLAYVAELPRLPDSGATDGAAYGHPGRTIYALGWRTSAALRAMRSVMANGGSAISEDIETLDLAIEGDLDARAQVAAWILGVAAQQDDEDGASVEVARAYLGADDD